MASSIRSVIPRESTDQSEIDWVLGAAVVTHANALGIIDTPRGATAADRIRGGLDRVAGSHPWLKGFGDLTHAETPTHLDLDAVARELTPERLLGTGTRPEITGFRLGDEYQKLSALAVKGRAFCQTPPFVADLLLELALRPALAETGVETTTIDPSCGSGHLLMQTLLHTYGQRAGHPEHAVAMISGVDIDPNNVLLARYRMLAFLTRVDGRCDRLNQVTRTLPEHIVRANSLLDRHPVLEEGQYDVVVGNPPYIVARDKLQNEAIRKRFPDVCHGKYSLALPFFALMTNLAKRGGRIAQITTNSFMKREFGRRFVEDYLPRYDLQWVIDTSGAYIPGHGTPTAILMHRNQFPTGKKVHVIRGNQGVTRRPDDPGRAEPWTQIVAAVHSIASFERFATGARAYAETNSRTLADVSVETEQRIDANREAIAEIGEQLPLFEMGDGGLVVDLT